MQSQQSAMDVQAIPALKDNYIWAVIAKAQGLVVIIDPGEVKPVLSFLEQSQLQLAGILLTHHHWDHTQGVADLKAQFQVPVFGPEKEIIPARDYALGEGDSVNLAGFPWQFQVLDIPGHTLGHLAYYANGSLFCGDTLFSAGCGRLFEGSPEQMYASLQKMAAYPPDTKIYCAHEYTQLNLAFAELLEPHNHFIQERIKHVAELRLRGQPSLPSLLSEEKATNPFLRCTNPELVAQVEAYAGKALQGSIEVFTWLRKWKDEFR